MELKSFCAPALMVHTDLTFTPKKKRKKMIKKGKILTCFQERNEA